jgi:uncharacterized protein YybS (DUF2232 family)
MNEQPNPQSAPHPDRFSAADSPEQCDTDNWIDDVVPSVKVAAPRRPLRSVDPNSPIIMVETAFLASAASLIWFVNFYFPMGPVLQIFFPAPIALVHLRWGRRACWMSALVAGLLLTIMMGPVRSIQYLVPFGLVGVLLGSLWYRRAAWGITIVLGTLLATLGTFFRIWLISVLLGDDLWRYSTIQVTGLLDWIATRLGLLVQPTLGLVQAIAVALIVVRNAIYLFVVHLVSWFLFDRLGNPIPAPPRWVQVLFDMEE